MGTNGGGLACGNFCLQILERTQDYFRMLLRGHEKYLGLLKSLLAPVASEIGFTLGFLSRVNIVRDPLAFCGQSKGGVRGEILKLEPGVLRFKGEGHERLGSQGGVDCPYMYSWVQRGMGGFPGAPA